jgi:hypothetical protein
MTPGRIKSGLANTRHRKKIVELESSIQQYKPVTNVEKKSPAPVSMPDETPKSTP